MMEFKIEQSPDELALTWVNEVRERQGKPTLAELPAPIEGGDRPRANPIAQAIGYPVYRHQAPPAVYANLHDHDEAAKIGRARRWTGRVEGYEVLLPPYVWQFA